MEELRMLVNIIARLGEILQALLQTAVPFNSRMIMESRESAKRVLRYDPLTR